MIAAADIHLQLKPPRCRTESEADWLEYQRRILRFIVDTANEQNDDLYLVGDIFDKAVSSPAMVRMFIEEMSRLRGTCYIMAGNHDLPEHSFDELYRSSYGVLEAMGHHPEFRIKSISESGHAYVPFGGVKPIGNKENGILFVHQFIVESNDDIIPGMTATTARTLAGDYPEFDLIICGDNHHSFRKNVKGQTILNCGCVSKRNIDFKDAELCIWRINEEEGLEIQRIPIPDTSVLVRDAAVEAKKESEEKFSELVALLKETGAMTLDYVANLRGKAHVLGERPRRELLEVVDEC